MDQNENNKKVIPLPWNHTIPADYAISLHIRNLMATYGETKVRNSIQELFGIYTGGDILDLSNFDEVAEGNQD